MKIVGISGSLRKHSSNSLLLRAVERVAPSRVQIILYDDLGELPPFNPDLDEEGSVPPDAVARLRSLLIGADAVLISSPEYAHGVPGVLKNMLDWLVSTGELVGKPVALLNASPAGGLYAQTSLRETLQTMNWKFVLEASHMEPFVGRKIVGEIKEEATLRVLESVVATLISKSSRH